MTLPIFTYMTTYDFLASTQAILSTIQTGLTQFIFWSTFDMNWPKQYSI